MARSRVELAAAAGCMILALAFPARGQGLTCALNFGNDINVSNDASMASEHSVAATMGLLGVGWADSSGGIKFARSTDGGQSFMTRAVPGSTGHFEPEVAADGNRVFIFTRQGTGASSGVGFFRSTDGGVNFTPVNQLPAGSATSVTDPVSAIHQGRVYVAYGAFGPGFTGAEIFLNFSSDPSGRRPPHPLTGRSLRSCSTISGRPLRRATSTSSRAPMAGARSRRNKTSPRTTPFPGPLASTSTARSSSPPGRTSAAPPRKPSSSASTS